MRFQKRESTVISTSKPEKVSEFSIRAKDMGFVLSLLRDKMYSDPITAICREVACNARDAHREVGKHDLPIDVHLPTAMNPQIEFADYGPGINPTRMEDIFINYGASTKRTTNQQTGGFGLGAKTPFAYTDTFSIVTVWNGKKREYTAFIDDSLRGLLHLVRTSDTDEPSGTRIIVPVMPKDNDKFAAKLLEATKYWKVKPNILGLSKYNVTQELFPIFMENDDFILYDNTNRYIVDKIAIVDEIAYKYNLNEILDYNHDLDYLQSKYLCLKFNTGEVTVTPNRESLQLDERTKKNISKKLFDVHDEIIKKSFEKIKNKKYLNDAESAFMSARHLVGNHIPKNVEWNGNELHCNFNRSAGSKDRMQIIHYYWKATRPTSNNTNHLNINDKIIVDNDWDYDDDGERKFSHSRITISRYINHQLEEGGDGRIFYVRFYDDDTETKWLDMFNQLPPENIVNFSKLPKPPRKRGTARRQVARGSVDAYIFDQYYCGKYEHDLHLRPDVIEKSGEGVYVLSASKTHRHFEAGDMHIDSKLSEVSEFKALYSAVVGEALPVHIVSRRFEKTLGDDWIRLDDFIKENAEDLLNRVNLRDLNTRSKVSYFGNEPVIARARELDKEFDEYLTKIEALDGNIPNVDKVAKLVGFDIESAGYDKELYETSKMFDEMYALIRGRYHVDSEIERFINMMIDYRRLKRLEKDGGISNDADDSELKQLDELQELSEAV